jgi:hypothetical protein
MRVIYPEASDCRWTVLGSQYQLARAAPRYRSVASVGQRKGFGACAEARSNPKLSWAHDSVRRPATHLPAHPRDPCKQSVPITWPCLFASSSPVLGARCKDMFISSYDEVSVLRAGAAAGIYTDGSMLHLRAGRQNSSGNSRVFFYSYLYVYMYVIYTYICIYTRREATA